MADFYFAYGSNLNRAQFRRRCPNARPVGRFTLPDYRLEFRGVANIIPMPKRSVEGAIYDITPRCEAALDRYEGWPHLYRKETVAVEMQDGGDVKVVEVMFYVMNENRISPPSPYYLESIEDGYNDWQIPRATLRAAVDRAYRFVAKRKTERKDRSAGAVLAAVAVAPRRQSAD